MEDNFSTDGDGDRRCEGWGDGEGGDCFRIIQACDIYYAPYF